MPLITRSALQMLPKQGHLAMGTAIVPHQRYLVDTSATLVSSQPLWKRSPAKGTQPKAAPWDEAKIADVSRRIADAT